LVVGGEGWVVTAVKPNYVDGDKRHGGRAAKGVSPKPPIWGGGRAPKAWGKEVSTKKETGR